MSFSSPGQEHSPWLASLPVKDWPLDTLLRSGDSYVPVALVPTNGGFILMKNPKVIQVELQKASSLFQKITEVRQFGRGGILCCSADKDCVRELLNCFEFAAQPDEAAAMKLIRWVELHIGRSRKRVRKTPPRQQESPGFPSDACRTHLGMEEPRASSLLPAMYICTGSLAASPAARQRNRIKTNPWVAPSPCNSADSGWTGSRFSTEGEDPTQWSSSMGCMRAVDDPVSAGHTRRQISGSSDDEAYSEDFPQSEGSNDDVVTAVETPQTDSACGSSCTTTPLSECSSSRLAETLADKVRRLQADRALVEQKMFEARVEEQASRYQRMQLHREMMQLRRLTLVHSLQELRSDLEQRAAFGKTFLGAGR
ncbi:uncharacterized protein LOC119173498 [Rhipicephalus microplus]|uniref:uncharacterized protein LOC119173498 n=1 Tax=Rhipicephalus microplus TaxID=6941 RepID=UPI003F6B526B